MDFGFSLSVTKIENLLYRVNRFLGSAQFWCKGSIIDNAVLTRFAILLRKYKGMDSL